MEWISVEDHKPPINKPFLGYCLVGFHMIGIGMKDRRSKEIHTCIWDDFNKRFEEYCNCSGCERDQEYIEITHWMPLSEPPEE